MNNQRRIEIENRRFEVKSAELPADLDTPVSAYQKVRRLGAAFLLESAENVNQLGRYSFIGFDSGESIVARDDEVIYKRNGQEETFQADPLEVVRAFLKSVVVPIGGDNPSILGAVVGYVGYDYVRFIEDVPMKPSPSQAPPTCRLLFVRSLVVFDHLERKMRVFSLLESGTDRDTFHESIVDALRGSFSGGYEDSPEEDVTFESNTSEEEYASMVQKARKHIYDGDAFQIVLSRRVDARCGEDPFQVYRRLRMSNPSPYLFFFDFGDSCLIGSSPEVLVKLTGKKAFVSPIAGTRRRDPERETDRALETELLADEKERAEHVMLVDLARNDLGRVSDYGSVQVSGYMRVDRYSHVMHIVSDVHGRLRGGLDQFDLFRAAFPAGTVTGAPKVRAMEIISDLEKDPRGIYAGAVGYFSPSGDMDACIAIRMIHVAGGVASLQAGAGIVADSDPGREFDETEKKLAAMKAAIRTSMGG